MSQDEILQKISSDLDSIKNHLKIVPDKFITITDIEEILDATPDNNLPKAEFGSIPDEVAAHDPVEFLRSIRGLERTN